MKKKAFTLTELLVVVVIIGVLAAVVLPKFAHVLEARKTTEADSIMQAIRSEQEARCTLDKDYTAQTAQLASFPANRGNNYSYTLSASGMSAAKADNSYVLHMAYRDGKICCQGDACDGLGKYERCTDAYIAKANNASDECAAEVINSHGPGPSHHPACDLPYEKTEGCGEGYEGEKYYVRNDECTGYNLVKDTCHCVPPDNKPLTYTEDCTTGSGTITYTWNTTSCKYDKSGSCDTTCQPTHNGQATYTENCPEGYTGTLTYTWNTTSCKYDKSGSCNKTCEPTHDGQASWGSLCPSPQVGSVFYTWNDQSCEYDVDDQCTLCEPTHNGEEIYFLQNCPSPQVGSGDIYTWSYETCEYKKTTACGDANGNNNTEFTWKPANPSTVTSSTHRYLEGTWGISSCRDACSVANQHYSSDFPGYNWPPSCQSSQFSGASCSGGQVGSMCTAERHAECFFGGGGGLNCCNNDSFLFDTGYHEVTCQITGTILQCS